MSAPSPLDLVAAEAEKLIADGHAPGVQVCVRAGGAMALSRGYGYANLETRTPMSDQSVLRIASNTKSFTAALILRQVDAGRVRLDDRLAKYVPKFPGSEAITIAHLITNTSGLGTFPSPATLPDPRAIAAAFASVRSAEDAVDVLIGLPGHQLFEPGAHWSYSNFGYLLLGAVLEGVEGRPFSQCLRDLTASLGLSRTAADQASEVVPGRAAAYGAVPQAPGGFINLLVDSSLLGAAGAMRSTSEEMCLWMEALLSGRVLSPAMTTFALSPGLTEGGVLPAPLPGAINPPVVSRDGKVRYGAGLSLEDPETGAPWAWHMGLLGGAISAMRRHREVDAGYAFVLNGTPGQVNTTAPIGPLMQALDAAALACA
ncbi:MAG: serine hydrolase domain-containing protein [Caulobacteraceae bacterium]